MKSGSIRLWVAVAGKAETKGNRLLATSARTDEIVIENFDLERTPSSGQTDFTDARVRE